MTGTSFAAALEASGQTREHRTIERLLDELPPDEAAEIETALRSRMSAPRISRALKLMGHDIGHGAVYGWRGRNAPR